MRNLIKLLVYIFIGLIYTNTLVYSYEGRREDSILLNGEWEFALGEGDESAYLSEGQEKLNWTPVTLPGPFMKWNDESRKKANFVWAKRKFDIKGTDASKLAVLRWERISTGATAYINGRKVGENEPTGPYQTIIPEGLLRFGQNEIVLKVTCGAGVRKSKTGHFLVPAGLINNPPNFPTPSIYDDIWIDFANDVYVKWALAIPDLGKSKVNIRVTPIGIKPVDGFEITVQVKSWPDGKIIGKGDINARLLPGSEIKGKEHFFIEVPMPGFKPWTYEDCNLYTAELKVEKNGKVLDEITFRFGMREIKVIDGNYKLNGKNLWLRGSNFVHEWDWADLITGKEKAYLVTEAREMNMNCFRTHTQPPPKHWADICDENGTMILAELPVTYNHRNCGFTPEEYEIWHKNVLTDAEGWLSRLWNHPSVIMWVLSNESHLDNEWESGPYRDFVLELDPTRPTMRTGDTKYMGSFSPSHAEVGGTEENLDIHTCYNVNRWTAEGVLQEKMPEWFLDVKNRTKTNTEYMNIFKTPPEQWTGINDKEAYDMVYAQLGMEHTEAMRRARLDCVLPYMYAGWTKTRTGREWKAGFAKPVSACWHSSLSPVLASLDLFNPNYHVGQKVTSDLYLINDSWHDAEVHVDLLITKECPEFIPEAECFENPLMKWSYDFTMKADNMVKTPIQWKLPDEEGNYWLTARLKGIPGRPVLSQRFVRAVKPVVVTESAKKRTFIILGSDDRSDKYFRSKNFMTSEKLNDLNPEKNIVLIWNTKNLTPEEKQSTTILHYFAESGGRIVILSTDVWDWKELCNVSVDSSRWSLPFSRVFMSKGVNHFMLSGIHKEQLIRWNGLPGTVALPKIKGPALEGARRILWASEPNSTIVAEIPIAGSKGKILFTQLDIQNHLDDSSADYDPAAERIFLNLLGQ